MINRHKFRLTSSNTVVPQNDTGILIGEIMQLRWYPDAADTGIASLLQLYLLPSMADTGVGWAIYNQSANLGVPLNRALRQAASYSTGADNSGDSGFAPIVGAGDRLRATVAAGDTGVVVAGDLYVWSKS